MPNRLMDYLRRNWLLLAFIAGLVLYIIRLQNPISPLTDQSSLNRTVSRMGGATESKVMVDTLPEAGGGMGMMPPIYDEPAPTDTTDRMVVRDSSLSLLVDSVRETIQNISDLATRSGGYLVNSNLSEPEGAATGSITIRVPVATRDQVLSDIRDLGLRVVDEHTYGHDVTDAYTDIEAQLATLRTTKEKFESLLASATTVEDSLSVQRELMNLQRQIDSYLGQQKYLEGNANLSRISVSLATDELALPYAPDEPWRPQAIFRNAVRSLLATLRGAVSFLIWLGVYAPIILLIAAVFWWYKRRHV